jgi:hypothetical protein
LIKKYGPVFFATGASQALMAASTFLFWTLGPAGADLYTVGIQVGNLSFTGFVMGVLYLAVVGRPNFKHWRVAGIAAIIVSLLGGVGGLVVVAAGSSNHQAADFLAVSFFGMGGAAVAFKAVKYVREACLGNPNRLAGVALIPNAALLMGLLLVSIFKLTGECSIILPALLWMIGSFVLLLDTRLTKLDAIVIKSYASNSALSPRDGGMASHFIILSVGLLTANFMPFIYIHILANEPDGAIAFGFLLIRIISSATYLISNSFLLVKFNWVKNKVSDGNLELRGIILIITLQLICLSSNTLNFKSVAITAAILALAIGLIISSFLLRELNFTKKNRPLFAKVVLDLLVSSFAAYVLFLNPSILGLFTVYLISQIITIMISSWGLGFRTMAVVSLFSLIICGVVLSIN